MGRGSYVDPVTGKQRVLGHPNDLKGTPPHVNDPYGRRVDIHGNSGQAELTARVGSPRWPSNVARFAAVVVFADPPLPLATAMIMAPWF